MDRPPRHIRKLLAEWAGRAHDRELGQALRELRAEFDRWERGEIDAYELNERIHRHHDGPSREIWKRYSTNDTGAVVAWAVVDGILKREELPTELAAYLADSIEIYQDIRRRQTAEDGQDEAEDED